MTASDQVRDLSSLIARVRLRDVRLWTSEVRTLIRNAESIEKPQLVLNYGARVLDRGEKSFFVAATLIVHVVDGENPPSESSPVYMKVVMALTYSAAELAEYEGQVLAEFASVNAIFNAWPYWREYVQSTASRMSLPPLLIPLYRGPSKTESAKGRETAQRALPPRAERPRAKSEAGRAKR